MKQISCKHTGVKRSGVFLVYEISPNTELKALPGGVMFLICIYCIGKQQCFSFLFQFIFLNYNEQQRFCMKLSNTGINC